MTDLDSPLGELRRYRNSRLYRSLTRSLRVYNRLIIERLQEKGFSDFSPAFPSMLSNLDTEGTRIGVLASRAGVSRQAAGQLLKEIERRGYVTLEPSPADARVTVARFTRRGRKLLATILELVEEIEGDFEANLEPGEFARVREGLFRIADRIDPVGAFGAGDAEEVEGAKGTEARRASRAPVKRSSPGREPGKAQSARPSGGGQQR